MSGSLLRIQREIVTCRACPRLCTHRERIARERRAAFRGQTYWGKPVPGFGDAGARLLVVGLAPAAHGGNRTGRVFTGDRSGDWLYRALFRAGFANQVMAISRDDGLQLRGAYVTAVVRCAPPQNRPLPKERDRCLPFLQRELRLLKHASVIVALGAFAWDGALRALRAIEIEIPTPRPRFGHGRRLSLGPYVLLGSFHPSQQNTFTGKLTEPMFDAVFREARRLVGA